MNITYILRIDVPLSMYDAIASILGVKSHTSGEYFEIIEYQDHEDSYSGSISRFAELIENNYNKLENIGISKDSISIWMLCEYEEQCNMEFIPEDMGKLGENGISLCISCWQSPAPANVP